MIFLLLMRVLFFQKIFLSVAVNAIAVFIAMNVFPDRFDVVSSPAWAGVIVVGFGLGLLNYFVKPLLKMIALPFIILSLGLFLLVINALIFYGLDHLLANFDIFQTNIIIYKSWLSYLFVGTVLAIINSLLHWLLKA